ncbi:MAG: hypothetical protein PF485_05715 [Bacteroidales bacterium]|jgi:DUF1009 family protein|nr:hypothetical protein [Bacteroidales bacterium]
MSYISVKIQTMFVKTPKGELTLSAKAGEDPEMKLFVGHIESSGVGMTNDGQLIKNHVTERAYIKGVFAYQNSDMPLIKSCIDNAKVNPNSDVPANIVMTNGDIYSNVGIFADPIVYNGTGTLELNFESAQDWITT